ncbi:MAG: hypothetical protein CMG26_06710 [Candidatus Marinimicrobia bacterium]|nr:hypothetical protein [Candidatus Neomarinimicrobiota bacterium]MBV68030.1 hypothetical protein [Candidatus Neomarinimicrobiota bacterium]
MLFKYTKSGRPFPFIVSKSSECFLLDQGLSFRDKRLSLENEITSLLDKVSASSRTHAPQLSEKKSKNRIFP